MFAPRSVPSAIGIMPSRVASEVIRMGAGESARRTTASIVNVLFVQSAANSTIRMLFETTMQSS